jgi:hypothetical protein
MVDGQRDGAPRPHWDPPLELPARAEAQDAGAAPAFLRLAPGPADDRIGASLFTGGLVAVHTAGRDRGAIWDALARREVYGTSGPRILLWLELLNAPDGAPRPMGGEATMRFAPRFRARAIGSQVQLPGCPDFAASGLAPERLARLCRGECFHPSDARRAITRIEVVRIRPQRAPGEPVDDLIDDPWQTFTCERDPAGCSVEFSDEDFAVSARDALYYVRAIEEPTPAVNGKGLGCQPGDAGPCTTLDATPASPDDDRLGLVEERAWSSPIFVDYGALAEGEPAALETTEPTAAPRPPGFDASPQGGEPPDWSQVEGDF